MPRTESLVTIEVFPRAREAVRKLAKAQGRKICHTATDAIIAGVRSMRGFDLIPKSKSE